MILFGLSKNCFIILKWTDTQNVFDHWLSDDRVTDNRVNAAHKSVAETYDRIDKIVREELQKNRKSHMYAFLVTSLLVFLASIQGFILN